MIEFGETIFELERRQEDLHRSSSVNTHMTELDYDQQELEYGEDEQEYGQDDLEHDQDEQEYGEDEQEFEQNEETYEQEEPQYENLRRSDSVDTLPIYSGPDLPPKYEAPPQYDDVKFTSGLRIVG
jgi:hypothetical protein